MKEIHKNKPSNQAKPLIATGFATILVLMVLLIGFWSKNLSDNKKLLLKMASKTIEARLITQLFNFTHQQTMVLHKLEKSTSDTEREKYYAQYFNSRNKLPGIINQLKKVKSAGLVKDAWNDIQLHLDKLHSLETKSLINYKKGNHPGAYANLVDNLPPIQDGLVEELSNLLDRKILNGSVDSVNSIISEASHKNTTTYILVYLLGGISIILGIFTIFILKRTRTTEEALIDQGERIQWLYEATSISGISLDERITETLKLGCRVLNMEIGKLGCQNPEKNESTFLNTVAPPELPAKRGLVLPLDKTFCNVTFSSDGPIAIHHVSESSFKDHPAAAFLGMEAYIGTTIYVHDKKFGTVNFSNRKPMERPFTQTDVDFVNLLGKWISITMEQIIIEEELQKSKEAAEAASQAKTTFLANMSHEIRTPLTAILGYSEMLLDEDQTQEEIDHEINSIITSGAHLQQIINDILDLSKIEAGQLVIEYRDIASISFFDELKSIMGPRANEKGLSFDIEYQFPIPGMINTDPTRLKQILINLCGNAIKFTREGGITITVKYLESSNQLSINVTDTGIGMSSEEQKSIFKPFTQADDSITRIYGGTGLGLCISKQLAQTLGGDIIVSSDTGKGSSFATLIDVCIDKASLEMINEKPATTNQFSDKSFQDITQLNGLILMVEDNPGNQALIKKLIHKTGLLVDIAENGKIAVEKALENHYDLILMDTQMPVMGGLEATRLLRDKGLDTPIIS